MTTTSPDASGDGAKLRESAGRVAREIGEEARSEGRRLRDEAMEGARRHAESTRDTAGSYLSTLATAIGKGADVFREDGMERTGAMLDRAAEEISGVAGRMGERRPEDLLREVQGFASRHPAVFFGSAFLLAFGAARVLRSSPPPSAPRSLPGTEPGPTGVGMPPGSSAGSATPIMGGSVAAAESRGEVS